MPTGEGPCACTQHGVAGCNGVKAEKRNKCLRCTKNPGCNYGPRGPECRCPMCKGACGNNHMGSRARCSPCFNKNCPAAQEEDDEEEEEGEEEEEEKKDEPKTLKDFKELVKVPFTDSEDVFDCARCGVQHDAGIKAWTCTGGHTFCDVAVATIFHSQSGRVKKCPTCDVHIL